MDYELRPATSDDYAYCYRLTKRNMYDLFCKHWGGWVPAEFRKGFSVENISMVIIAGKRAGYLSVIKEPTSLYIDNIQLSPAWQGRGIGAQLLKRLLADHSDVSVRLTTFEDNPAKRLYERMGFVVLEREGMTVKMEKNGPIRWCRRR
ncbi:MAG: GNAT family N-acetyltransferase [Methylobacter sp.]|uniref:GNAT family N-acetyltransferase n=1 Tax=Methylobacter sp. TaxID=2051955 RepID=UPI0025851CCB|nr:GNAT family N-acetyltransferase [Methylobacter sp.]MCL7422059.1 GNAT family N-acetyltransferase [Methylobacter sp.]